MGAHLVSGSNSGIGLEIVRQLCSRGETVYAACRTTTPELDEAGARVITGIDVSTDESMDALRDAIGDTSLETVISSAGIIEATGFPQFDFERISRIFQVNTLGALRVVAAIFDNLRSGSKLAFLTSRLGSIKDNYSGGSYGYRLSKAALNMAGASLARDLAGRKIIVGLIHPGYVKTSMTGGRGNLTAKESAAGVLARIDELTLQSSGTFVHADGQKLPW